MSTERAQEPLAARQQEILRKARTRIEALTARLSQPIAIVGMACHMPGARNVEELWSLLEEGREALSEVPRERWDMDEYYAPTPGTPFKTYSRRAGYLDDVDRFDAKFFGISPREAQQMDPQQRLLLEVSYHALENARIPVTALHGQAVGVFVGISSSEYAVMTFGRARECSQDAYSITGTSLNSAAGRLAYTYGCNGPALAIDTACSSSLVAIYQACRSLVAEECHTALAGGVNCLLTPEPHIALAQNKVLSPSGRCSPFSAQADGLVRGEGCGVLVLKRLADAQAENCRILAVIRAGHVNQDGASSGLTVPNGYAQQALIRRALESAKLRGRDLGYIEAHGTGTSLGDPIELNALAQSLCAGEERATPLWLGSIKANIGHLEAASGVAGVLKVVLALQKRTLPPQIHFTTPTDKVDWRSLGLRVSTAPVPLEFGAAQPFYAGVSSFGFSGTNAHLIIQDPVSATAVRGTRSQDPSAADPGNTQQFLGVSAKEPQALKQLLKQYREVLAGEPDWRSFCAVSNGGRAHYRYRRGFVAPDRAALLTQLQKASETAGTEVAADGEPPSAAWLFTGQGSQYAGMGRALFDAEPRFAALMQQCDAAVAKYLGTSILPVIWNDPGLLNSTRYTQPALFCLEYALSQFLAELHLRPRTVLGHSIGEYAAAVLAGVFCLEDAARMIVHRGRLMEELCAPGKMLVVLAEQGRVRDLMSGWQASVDIAVSNGPKNHVLSGEPHAIEQIARAAAAAGVRVFVLPVSRAFHSRMMLPMLADFRRVVAQTTFNAPRIRMVSSTLGRLAGAELADPEYWVAHVREPVQYQQAAVALFESRGTDSEPPDVCVEIGPHEQLINMARTCVDSHAAHWLSLLRPSDDLSAFAGCLQALYERGAQIQWPRHASRTEAAARSEPPSYPFERQRHWLPDYEPVQERDPGGRYEVVWQDAAPAVKSGHDTAPRHWLILSTAGPFADGLAAKIGRRGHTVEVLPPASELLRDHSESASYDDIVFWGGDADASPQRVQAALYELISTLRHHRDVLASGQARLHCVVMGGAGGYSFLGAGCAALKRSLQQEDPSLRFNLIALDPGTGADQQADALIAELLPRGPSGEQTAEIAIAAGRRLTPRLVECDHARPAAAALASIRADRTYLITGGTSAVGILFARVLFDLGARNIVLLARNAAAQGTRSDALESLTAQQRAALTFHSADVSDYVEMEKLIAKLQSGPAPLGGVIHAAGAICDRALWRLTPTDLERVFTPKVGGAWVLDRLTRAQPLDFFLLVSSLAAVLGAVGQANYAAANAYLEALAAQRRALGLPGCSVALGPVAGSGMASGERARERFERAGLGLLQPDWLAPRLRELLLQRGTNVVLARFDWPRIRGLHSATRLPLLASFLPAPGSEPIPDVTARVQESPERGTPPSPQSVAGTLKTAIASVLGLQGAAEIRDSDTLNALGMDSITLLELRDRLVRALGCDVPTHVLFDFPQVGKLARQLAAQLTSTPTSGGSDHAAAAAAAAAEAPNTGVAVIGMACRFPGGASSPEKLWSLLCAGTDAIGTIDELRWESRSLLRDGLLATARAGLIEGIDRFDCELFGISAREAQSMDPQQRLLLEVSWEALERAGYDFGAAEVAGGVFVGPGPNDYARRFDPDPKSLTHHMSTGNATSVIAGRLSFVLDWHGPALAIDTACSSSLMAVHLAVNALNNRECDIALAGGVNLLLSPETSVLLSKGGMLAPDGCCKAFDAAADGYVRSEGCAMIVLKRLADALADGDDILAVIRGSAANHDGHSQGLTAPNGQAQQRVLRSALAASGLPPERIELLEAHGTGTPLGDPIEMAAIQAVYGAAGTRRRPLCVGSVKTNIGHAEAAAGIAGLIKAVLSLRYATIVPHLHLRDLNPEIDATDPLIIIPTSLRHWESATPRCAAVSSFGFSGTNVHVILESGPELEVAQSDTGQPATPPLRISAVSPEAVRAYLEEYRRAIAAASEDEYRLLCVGSWRRADLGYTLLLNAASAAAAVAEIDLYRADATLLGKALRREVARVDLPARVAFRHCAPTYPFARTRFWLPLPQRSRRRPLGIRLGDRSSPVISYIVDYVDDPPYQVEDHVVHGAVVVPAAAHLALLIGMLRELSGLPSCQIDAVICEDALVITPATQAVRYVFTAVPPAPEQSEQSVGAAYDVVVVSERDGRELRHLRARIAALSDDVAAARASMRPSEDSADPLARIAAESFYDELYDPEVKLGTTFRRVALIEQHVGRCVARLETETQPSRAIEPGELDSILQTIALATLARQPGTSHMHGATIPFTIDRIVMRAGSSVPSALERTRILTCTTQLVREDLHRGAFVHNLVAAQSGTGAVLQIEGLLTQQIGASQLTGGHAIPVDYLVEEWLPAASSASARSRVKGEVAAILLNVDESPVCRALQELLDVQGVVPLTPGNLEELQHRTQAWPDSVRVVFWLPARQDCEPGVWMQQVRGLVEALQTAMAWREGRLGLGPGAGLAFTIVTERSAPVTAGDTPVPLYGVVLGLCKSLQLEEADFPISLLDLEETSLRDSSGAILDELLGDPPRDIAAYRDGRRHALRVRKLSPPEIPPPEIPPPESTSAVHLRADGIYVVTGGLGDLAIQTCRWLSGQGVRRLALIGRSPMSDAVRQRMDGIVAGPDTAAVTIEYHCVDVADYDALAKLFEALGREGPIRGIVHTAGVLADGTFRALKRSDFEAVFQAKISGSWNLHRLSQHLPLDCFVLYSSLAALFGAAGQANYAAANGFMDQLALYRRRLGMPALSINWGAWACVGMAARTQYKDTRPNGLVPLEPAQCLAALGSLLGSPRAQVGVASIHLPTFVKRWQGAGRVPPLISAWIPAKALAPPAAAVVQELLRTPRGGRAGLVKEHLKTVTRAILTVPADHPLPDDKSFQQMGFDSLMSVELKERLHGLFGLQVPATLIFDYPSIETLARFTLESLQDGMPQKQDARPDSDAMDAMDERELADVLAKL